jgi:hypothetical protein
MHHLSVGFKSDSGRSDRNGETIKSRHKLWPKMKEEEEKKKKRFALF